MSLLDDVSILVTPNGFKGGTLHSAIPSDGSADMDVTRATAGTRVDENGLVNYAEVLGSELVTNGDFDSNTTGWGTKNSTIVWDNGKLKVDNSSGNQYGGAYQNIGLVAGKQYKMTLTMQLLTGPSNGTFSLFTSTSGGNGQSSVYTGGVLVVGGAPVTETFTFTPASGDVSIQPYVNEPNAIFTIDNVSVKQEDRNNVPRIDYSDGGCPHILVEPQRTNLITYSEDFSNVSWATNNATVSSGFTSPDGTTNAYKLNVTANNGQVLFNVTNSTTDNKSISVFAKANTSTSKLKIVEQNYFGTQATFDLNLGVIDSSSTTFSKMENYGNGWYRCTVIQAYSSGLTGVVWAFRSPTIDSLFLWGGQAEVQSQATTYIKSDGIASVRKATTTNLVLYSEDFNNAIWSKVAAGTGNAPIVTSDYSLSPIGTQTADRIQFNLNGGTGGGDTSYITTSLSAGTINASASIYLKTNDSTTKDITLRLGTSLFDYDVTVTSEWQRFSLSGNTSVDRIQLLLYGNKNSQTADLSVWGVQVEQQTQAEKYAPTFGLPVTIDLFTENNYGTMTNMTASDIVPDTPNN